MLLFSLIGASLAMLAYLWPAGEPHTTAPEDDPDVPASGRPAGRQAELHRLVYLPPPVSTVAAAAISMDFHGVVKDSATGVVLKGVTVRWAMAMEGDCEIEGVDWSDAAVAEDGTFTIARGDVEGSGDLCLDLEAEGHVSRSVSATQVSWPAGRPGLAPRLKPHGKIRGRVFRVDGKPAAETDIYTVFGDAREAVQEVATDKDGWYELEALEPGRYLVYAESEYNHTASFAEVRLEPGEARRLDLREREVPSVKLEGRVVDSSGRPVSRVAVKIEPREESRNPGDRYFLARSATSTWRGGTFDADLGRAGWYRVSLYAGDDSKQVMGQADLYVGGGQQVTHTIVYRGKVTACTLHDAAGRRVDQSSGFSMTVSRGCTSLGMGFFASLGSRARYQDMRFPWPPGARSVTLTLHGHGLSGSIQLEGADAVCRVVGRPPR